MLSLRCHPFLRICLLSFIFQCLQVFFFFLSNPGYIIICRKVRASKSLLGHTSRKTTVILFLKICFRFIVCRYIDSLLMILKQGLFRKPCFLFFSYFKHSSYSKDSARYSINEVFINKLCILSHNSRKYNFDSKLTAIRKLTHIPISENDKEWHTDSREIGAYV